MLVDGLRDVLAVRAYKLGEAFEREVGIGICERLVHDGGYPCHLLAQLPGVEVARTVLVAGIPGRAPSPAGLQPEHAAVEAEQAAVALAQPALLPPGDGEQQTDGNGHDGNDHDEGLLQAYEGAVALLVGSEPGQFAVNLVHFVKELHILCAAELTQVERGIHYAAVALAVGGGHTLVAAVGVVTSQHVERL